jgi:hypothetical protein
MRRRGVVGMIDSAAGDWQPLRQPMTSLVYDT